MTTVEWMLMPNGIDIRYERETRRFSLQNIAKV